ncbi:MAG: twin transmembrane helix small protein [Solirubrobacterales bacterium]
MAHYVPLLLGGALALVVIALLTGVSSFVVGGPWYRRNANRLMNLRVGLQAVAVLLLAWAVYLAT